jgi:HEPN domain-containing protein
MKRLTKEWVQKAESDFLAATKIAGLKLPHHEIASLHEVVCFHCQQSAEKYLKGLLQESGDPVPRTHNLVELLALVVPHYRLRGLRRGLSFLTDFAVDIRYPPVRVRKRQAVAALRWAGKVRDACREMLRI